MKAIVLRRPGSADRLELMEVPTPQPGPGEALVRIHVSSVTRGDVVMRKMPRLVARMFGEVPRTILGNEFAGQVVGLGAGVVDLEVGDRVFGSTSGLPQGSHAEYIAVQADGLLATIPDGIGYEDAGLVPVGAMTALHFLDEAGVGADTRVLVNGGSGSVGSFAVQIARDRGAHVTGVASAANRELVLALGAERALDYRSEDFTEEGGVYDVVFDATAKLDRKRAEAALVPGGRFVSTRSRRKENRGELMAVRDLLAAGALRPVVDSRFPLERVADAHRRVEAGKKGNVLVIVGESEGGDDD